MKLLDNEDKEHVSHGDLQENGSLLLLACHKGQSVERTAKTMALCHSRCGMM